MKHIRTTLIITLWGLCLDISAQTLDECQRMACENYPGIAQYDLIGQTNEVTLSNIKRGWLPRISAQAQVTAQNKVAEYPEHFQNILTQTGMEFEGLKKVQYKAGIDLVQNIYDGGVISSQAKVVQAQSEMQTRQADVQMYSIRQRVNDIYFGLLLMDEQLKLNGELQKNLNANIKRVEALASKGVALQSDADVIKAELVDAQRKQTEIEATKNSLRRLLGIFIGKDVGEIIRPELWSADNIEQKRPELSLYDAQINLAEAKEDALNANVHPTLNLFASGYWGYPSYNMFADMQKCETSLNGIVGLKLSWNLSSLYTIKGERQKLQIQKSLTETQRKTFLFNSQLQTTEEDATIAKFKELITKDDELVELRKSIRTATERKLEKGIADTNDLTRDLTRENQALLEKSIHEIEMLKTIYELKNTVNN